MNALCRGSDQLIPSPLSRVLPALLVAASWLVPTTDNASAAAPLATAPSADFAVARGGRPLLVSVAIADREYLFCVDTGAARTAFDSELRHLLGTSCGKVVLRTSAGFTRVETYTCPKARVGSLDLQTIETVVCCDLEPIRLATGEAIYGILGMDFLSRFAVEIDFDSGRLRLWEHAPPSWHTEGEVLPLVLSHDGAPYTIVTLPENQREPFLVDTGANLSSLRTEIFDLLLAEGELRPGRTSRALTVAGEVHGTTGFVRRVAVGSFVHEQLRFDRDCISALGLRYLSRFLIRLDPKQERIYLAPGAAFAGPERTATSGLSVIEIAGRKTVCAVEPGSAASVAGLRPGDVIISIEDRDAKELNLFEIGEMLTSEVGRSVSLRLRRSDGEFEVTVTLGDRLSEAAVPSAEAADKADGRSIHSRRAF